MIGTVVEVGARTGVVVSIRQDPDMGEYWLIEFDDCCQREFRAPIRQEKNIYVTTYPSDSSAG
jgi:hypothetical protein